MKESFLLYKSFYEPVKGLSIEDKGMLFDALFQYQIEGIEPSNTSRIYMPFMFFKNQFRLDDGKYQKIVERNKLNGSKGGRPKNPIEPKKPSGLIGNPENPSEPRKPDNDNDNDNEKGNDNVKDLLKKRALNFKREISQYKNNYDNSILDKFFEYWSEPNKSKTKMKFEQQKTWDLNRRLKRWAANNFNKENSNQKTKIHDQDTNFDWPT